MDISSFGLYPLIQAQVDQPVTVAELAELLKHSQGKGITVRGCGRSYGDSALGPHLITTAFLHYFRGFDESTGLLTCDAGVSLAEILKIFVPRGWFLSVTPGTQFISVGGAIASDVHGKNHHREGCFSQYVHSLKLMLASGEIVDCSATQQAELFHATCGGMGLTGVIVQASFYLKRITTAMIHQTSFKATSLEQAFELFETHANAHYSVAWIDCLASGSELGRSLLMLGEHATQGTLSLPAKKKVTIPCAMPDLLLTPWSIKLFNAFYFHHAKQAHTEVVHYEKFFYPLDRILHWNRLYGKKGFTQYQFVLPKNGAYAGMKRILEKISASKRGSFLAVLKAFGPENKNFLSFPMEGYTLALDFKIDAGLFTFLDELDDIVLEYGGRLYLTKDVRMSEAMFKHSYPRYEAFSRIRKKHGAEPCFHSLQSRRLKI